jgi:prepilin-type N-terminal cleavage/methylation domain-containing protein
MLNRKIQNGSRGALAGFGRTSSPPRVKSRGGFSLAEVLMAMGILALGMVFIAGVFPAGVHYTIISTERTMAAVVADEAFAKIRLYGLDFNSTSLLTTTGCTDFMDASRVKFKNEHAAMGEFLYPSDPDISSSNKKYCWSALCRRIPQVSSQSNENLVQVTVFVNRLTGAGTKYPEGGQGGLWPMPVKVQLSNAVVNSKEVTINFDQKTYVAAGSTIAEDTTGRIYRVLSHDATTPEKINLDKPWQGPSGSGVVWVIPPPVGGGRYPCIGVFQKVILFNME